MISSKLSTQSRGGVLFGVEMFPGQKSNVIESVVQFILVGNRSGIHLPEEPEAGDGFNTKNHTEHWRPIIQLDSCQ
jgi:hypothetical protein